MSAGKVWGACTVKLRLNLLPKCHMTVQEPSGVGRNRCGTRSEVLRGLRKVILEKSELHSGIRMSRRKFIRKNSGLCSSKYSDQRRQTSRSLQTMLRAAALHNNGFIARMIHYICSYLSGSKFQQPEKANPISPKASRDAESLGFVDSLTKRG